MAATSGGYDVAKRLVDIAVAVTVLTVCAPLALFAAARIKLEDGGPILYRGTRVGLSGRPFRMLKFRSMIVLAAEVGGSSTADGDSRLTHVGTAMRRWKLDELPQFVNVLRGEMSLVGPRPQVEWDVERYTERERRLLSVRPGITDWASVVFRDEGAILAAHGDADRGYDELIRPRKIELGLAYVTHRSLQTDFHILWLTALAVLRSPTIDTALARSLPGDAKNA